MQLMEEDAAIWALEKQIPKKPIKDDDNVVCPMCGTIIGVRGLLIMKSIFKI